MLNLSHNPEIKDIFCQNNKLTHLDLNGKADDIDCITTGNVRIVLDGADISILGVGFDLGQVTNLTGGNFNGGAIHFDEGSEQITYHYVSKSQSGNDIDTVFVLAKEDEHKGVLVSGKAATCTQNGFKQYYKCECGSFFEDASCVRKIEDLEAWKQGDGKLNALGHKYSNWVSDGNGISHTRSCQNQGCNATETENCFGGTATCTDRAVCDACKTAYGKTANHDFSGKVDASDENGHWHICNSCDAADIPQAHSFTVYIYNNDATYFADGTETAVCDAPGCGKKHTRTKANTTLSDGTAPVVNGIEDGKTYCILAEFTVNEENLRSVTADGKALFPTEGKYQLSAGKHIVTVTDKAGNSVTYNITVNKTHTPKADDGDCTTPVYCSVCNAMVIPARDKQNTVTPPATQAVSPAPAVTTSASGAVTAPKTEDEANLILGFVLLAVAAACMAGAAAYGKKEKC